MAPHDRQKQQGAASVIISIDNAVEEQIILNADCSLVMLVSCIAFLQGDKSHPKYVLDMRVLLIVLFDQHEFLMHVR